MNRALLKLAAWTSDRLPSSIRRSLYRLGPVSSALRAVLSGAAPAGWTEIEVAAGPLKGIKLQLDLKSEKDIWLGNYEPDLLAALPQAAPAGSVAYDIGANLGLISLALGACVGPEGLVVAFEALPANVNRLRANLALNDCGKPVRVEAAAVGAAPGRANFLVHASGGMGKLDGSGGRNEIYDRQIEVPVISLDEYVFEGGHRAPSLIKIDVEGGEGLVLKGAQRLLKTNSPKLLIELHGPEASAAVWELLARNGYNLRKLKSDQPVISDPSELSWKDYVMGIPPRPAEARP